MASIGEPGQLRALRADAAIKQSAIVEAALRLFANDPGTEMNAVARAAGVSRATLYRRFPTRDHLLAELRRHAAAASLAALQGIASRQPGERGDAAPGARLRAAVAALADLALRYKALLLDGIAGERPTDENREIRGMLTRLVQAAQESGEVRHDEVSADWIVSVISAHLTALARASHRVARSPGGLLNQLEATLFDGIGTQPAIPTSRSRP